MVKNEPARPRDPLAALTDGEKLLVLAAWFDMWDRPETDRQTILDDPRNPGRNDVQSDLRRIAATLDAIRPSGDTTCENCGKVAEVDAETGDCRECFASLHTRPSGDEALRAAIESLDGWPGSRGREVPGGWVRRNDVLAALATPSSTPDVEGLLIVRDVLTRWWSNDVGDFEVRKPTDDEIGAAIAALDAALRDSRS